MFYFIGCCSSILFLQTGGAYIPPARLKMMQENIADKSRYNVKVVYTSTIPSFWEIGFVLTSVVSLLHSEAYQRLSWEALKKSINGLINKVLTHTL